jgi:hypothetical protein
LKQLRQGTISNQDAEKTASGVLASSLAAALLDGLFEHPEANLTVAYMEDSSGVLCVN